MPRIKVDKIDRQILSDLQRDGRMTNVQLAHRAGISAPPCLRRVRALEEAQIIRGYHADLDAESLGFGVTVFAQVGLSSQAEADAANSGHWPSLRMTASAGLSNVSPEVDEWLGDPHFYAVGVGVEIPIFSGLKTMAETDAHRARTRALENQLADFRLQLRAARHAGKCNTLQPRQPSACRPNSHAV